jgi:outer membrane biosynthesis protein TonB
LVNGVHDIVAVGKGIDRTAGKRVLAGLAVLAIVLISGLLAAWGVSPPARHAISPADVVALRFPADYDEADTTSAAPPATYALASVAEARAYDSAILFNPNLNWPVQVSAAVEPVPQANVTTAAAEAAPKPEIKPEIKAEAKPEPKAAPKAEPKPVVVASRSVAPHVAPHHAAPHPRRESGVLFNDAQLASIKTRLKLSDYQEQYWPAVASALHALGQRAAREPVRQASAYANEGPLSRINPDGPEVEQLKSAAFPLIMSMNDEQKNQVRMLAHVMGLEQVASSF